RPAWVEHRRFGAAAGVRGCGAFAEIRHEDQPQARLVFTAHSVPLAMAEASPYVSDLTAASRAVADRLGHPRWSIAYQSRSGSPREPWLEAGVAEALRPVGGGRGRPGVGGWVLLGMGTA